MGTKNNTLKTIAADLKLGIHIKKQFTISINILFVKMVEEFKETSKTFVRIYNLKYHETVF